MQKPIKTRQQLERQIFALERKASQSFSKDYALERKIINLKKELGSMAQNEVRNRWLGQ